MRYAICNELFEGWAFGDVVSFVAETGYDGLELAPFTLAAQPTALSPDERRGLREKARAHGLALTGLHWLLAGPPGLHVTHPDRAVREHTLAYLEGLIDLGSDLEAPILVLGSPRQRSAVPPLSPAQATNLLVEGLGRLAPHAAQRGVTLCMEPLPAPDTDVVNTVEQAIDVIERVGHPAVRLILDVKSMCAEGQPLPALIARGAPYAAHFHANDRNLGGPGSGDVDFRPILAALADAGYAGWVSVEVFDFTAGARAIARDSLAYLRACAPADAAPQDRTGQ
jgi:sugar phosphate isomerase/epimerase